MNLKRFASSPVRDVTFGSAMKISLDHYYDLLKQQAGGLQAEEFLQLKLAADTLDLSDDKKPSEGGYTWFSYYNLLNRSDKAIEPQPVAGEYQVGLETVAAHYERFLRQLRKFVVTKVLSPEEQLAIADIDKALDSLKRDALAFYVQDKTQWALAAEAMGFNVGDWGAYIQWSNTFGHIRNINRIVGEIQMNEFKRKTILDRQYPTPADKEVVQAEFDFESPYMRLRYPTYPDFVYPEGDQFNPVYLARLPMGSTALFDDRRTATWDKTLPSIKSSAGGAFTATMTRSTTESSSMSTDWSGSGSAGYGWIRVNASASQHVAIQEEFSRGQSVTIAAKAVTRVNTSFPGWFKPTLFKHKHVLENPLEFQEFFGPRGSLLYYPTALILVRGFEAKFDSSQAWTYDYERKFNASSGGGFSVFGISFGASSSYSEHVKEHKVDRAGTSLTIGDDKDTLRFVGYAVKKNDVLSDPVDKAQAKVFAKAKS